MKPDSVAVIPCSGIGKSLGTVGREAAYLVAERFDAGEVFVPALAPLVLGDPESVDELFGSAVITVDGCRLGCARKTVEECRIPVAGSFAVMEAQRQHRNLKPQGVRELNDDGLSLAEKLADEIAEQARTLIREDRSDPEEVTE